MFVAIGSLWERCHLAALLVSGHLVLAILSHNKHVYAAEMWRQQQTSYQLSTRNRTRLRPLYNKNDVQPSVHPLLLYSFLVVSSYANCHHLRTQCSRIRNQTIVSILHRYLELNFFRGYPQALSYSRAHTGYFKRNST